MDGKPTLSVQLKRLEPENLEPRGGKQLSSENASISLLPASSVLTQTTTKLAKRSLGEKHNKSNQQSNGLSLKQCSGREMEKRVSIH